MSTIDCLLLIIIALSALLAASLIKLFFTEISGRVVSRILEKHRIFPTDKEISDTTVDEIRKMLRLSKR